MLDWIETGGPPTAEPARLGFGLTIVRSSIEAQFRGGVCYDWRPEGLRCRLSIPARPDRRSPADARGRAGRAAGQQRRRRSLAGMRLLVVEDELLVSMLVEDMLTDLGASVARPLRRGWPTA